MNTPLVSIICTAYNHELYIKQCLDSFIIQKTDFEFEVVINDDASTDKTASIIKEYEQKYPLIIKPIYQTENQYSKRSGLWRTILFPRAKGKYIAICEGDDYWTDPLKLQKQVDFMEKNGDFTLICGGFKSIGPTGEKVEILENLLPPDQEDEDGFYFTLRDFSKVWLTKTLTTLFRNIPDLTNYSTKYQFSRDIHLFYHLLKSGKGYYMKQVLGVYNKHEGGVFSLKSREQKLLVHYYIYKDMYLKSPDEFTRVKYLETCADLLNLRISISMKDDKIRIKTLLPVLLKLVKTKSDLSYLIKSLIPSQIKAISHSKK